MSKGWGNYGRRREKGSELIGNKRPRAAPPPSSSRIFITFLPAAAAAAAFLFIYVIERREKKRKWSSLGACTWLKGKIKKERLGWEEERDCSLSVATIVNRTASLAARLVTIAWASINRLSLSPFSERVHLYIFFSLVPQPWQTLRRNLFSLSSCAHTEKRAKSDRRRPEFAPRSI